MQKSGVQYSHIELGNLGERMATFSLRQRGWKILYRNFRGARGGEVDIVARDGGCLVFVEVKTRKKRVGSRPLDAVNKEKQELIERGARSWLSMLPDNDFLWRFDVVEVVLEEGSMPQIIVVEDAF